MSDLSSVPADVRGARSPRALDLQVPLLVLENDSSAPNFYVEVSAVEHDGKRVASFSLVRGTESAIHGLRWEAHKDQELLVVRFVLGAGVQRIEIREQPCYVELGPVREGEPRTQKMKVGRCSSSEHFNFDVVFDDGRHDPIMVVTPY